MKPGGGMARVDRNAVMSGQPKMHPPSAKRKPTMYGYCSALGNNKNKQLDSSGCRITANYLVFAGDTARPQRKVKEGKEGEEDGREWKDTHEVTMFKEHMDGCSKRK